MSLGDERREINSNSHPPKIMPEISCSGSRRMSVLRREVTPTAKISFKSNCKKYYYYRKFTFVIF
jgi:hypothetical protein